ncbi:MAG: alpha/beta hydrolase [Muribaculaceae bacterium]|nr:alpha/beta hydrolase [Muribaculaceae bacterium]
MKKKVLYISVGVVGLLLAALVCVTFYMVNYSLAPDPERGNTALAYEKLYERVPDMKPWVDSLQQRGLWRDTFVVMPSGERAHALYLRGDSAKGRTAIVVHGYKDTSLKFAYLGRMYQRDLGYNILMPDLHAHGQSEGDAIQMGWKDREDVMRWIDVAEELFRDSVGESRIVVHGVSMGAATTMNVSGEQLPDYVRCFVEDCGYTSVWDEFSKQLDDQFGLPTFPLLNSASLLTKLRYGWSFGEASPLEQVAKCERPMLFIHGDSDTFVPTWMVQPLYDAKPGAKELWLAPGSEHAKAYLDHPAEYTRRVADFVRPYMAD